MEQSELVLKIISTLESLSIPYMLTGAQASGFYGEPRFTRDIDIVADLDKEKVKKFIKYFPEDEFYCDEEMILKEISKHGQFNIIHFASGLKIDIILTKSTPFSKIEFSRRTRHSILPKQEANIATPEDIIIKKMEYYKEGGSEKHLRDITGILKISGEIIDYNYIAEWAGKLGLTDIWKAILNKIDKSKD